MAARGASSQRKWAGRIGGRLSMNTRHSSQPPDRAMELTFRKGNDVFVPTGGYKRLESSLAARRHELAEVPTVVLSCFDQRTRLLPFLFYDKRIFPAGARVIAGAMQGAGFTRTRAVFDLWNPNFRPSQAKLDGRPVQSLLISSMQMHSAKAFAAIRDAWTMGEDRPLI